jgi:glycolate oxidase FAD binding subunit
MAGSWGTLAVLTEITIKTLPRPESETTVAVLGLDDATAVAAMTAAMGSPCEVTGAAHLPAPGVISLGDAVAGGRALTVLRLEGVPPSVTHRKAILTDVVRPFGAVAEIDALASRALWRDIRDAMPFAATRSGPDQPLWRISTAPGRGAELARMITGSVPSDVLYDWAGGLLWVLVRDGGDGAGAAAVRRAVAATGGHATLIRAPASLRAAVAVFEPQDAALAALTMRVKAGFDPKGVLNPGRMWAGA